MRAKPRLPEWYYHPEPGQCRWCGKPIIDEETGNLNRRRHWHQECIRPCILVTQPAVAANAVLERDKGICQICKLDILALERTRDELLARLHTDTEPTVQVEFDKLRHQMLALGFKERHITKSVRLYEIDHILPVWKSKGDLDFFSLENLQLLDFPCHAAKTKQDMKDRRWQKAIMDGTPELAPSIRQIPPSHEHHDLHDCRPAVGVKINKNSSCLNYVNRVVFHSRR